MSGEGDTITTITSSTSAVTDFAPVRTILSVVDPGMKVEITSSPAESVSSNPIENQNSNDIDLIKYTPPDILAPENDDKDYFYFGWYAGLIEKQNRRTSNSVYCKVLPENFQDAWVNHKNLSYTD